ncbi:MAG TPA: hypothetical protein VM432_14205 [Bdellovibrionales bacterium]|jgi:hypothetical protein|nr:hypothetical protein [Bdellovibrionales bacterium]
MGIFKALGDFLFGKDPDIFDEQGRVRHKFPEEKWKKWNDRLKANPEYDWREHGAKERIKETPKKH